MKKLVAFLCVITITLCSVFTLSACGKSNNPPDDGSQLPTAQEVVNARSNVKQANTEGYNFYIDFTAGLSILGISGELNGRYSGEYRNDKTTGEETFKRSTSGQLLYDSTAYVFTKNSQKIKLNVDENNIVTKSSVMRVQDEDVYFANKVFDNVIDDLVASNIQDIDEAPATTGYDYQATLNIFSDNVTVGKLIDAVSALGTTIAFKGIEVTNPTAIPIFFNLGENNRLEDFIISLQLSIEIKAATVFVSLTYAQEGATNNIAIPSSSSLIVENDQISAVINDVNSQLAGYKTNDTYSLDVVASNEFDPSWMVLATKDVYTARLYKNTVDDVVSFNHSFKYKVHHEEDGAETYKYTLGNVTGDEEGVYLVSRKGVNTHTLQQGITVNTQFDYLVNPFIFQASNVDCIKKETKDNKTTYNIHLNNTTAKNIQNKILGFVNSNNEEGVVKVNNYFNDSNCIIDNAKCVVELENNKLVKITLVTDLIYNPTGGEYIDYNITLTNKLELEINANYNKAEDYEAPSSTGTIVGIRASKYYIL